MKYKAVLFDLDGTLISNYVAIHACLVASFEEFDIQPPTYDVVVHTIGGSILTTVGKLLMNLDIIDGDLTEKIANRYIELFPKFIFDGILTMPYAIEILKVLKEKGLRLACFTNKQYSATIEVVKELGMDKYFDEIFAPKQHSPRKPDKEFTQMALITLGLEASEVLGIGDSPYDYKAARVCNVDSALVATGGDSKEFLMQNCPQTIGVFDGFKDLALNIFDVNL